MSIRLSVCDSYKSTVKFCTLELYNKRRVNVEA